MMMLFFEQIGMGSGTVEGNAPVRRVKFVNEHPVALNMTFPAVFEVASQEVVFTFRGQGLFRCNKVNKSRSLTMFLPRRCIN
jgi:hypothetical protein